MRMSLPVACQLTDRARRTREAEIRSLITSGARHVEFLPDGLSLRFDGTDEWVDRIAELIKLERGCCRFLRFRLDAEPGDGEFSLSITGPEGTADFLRSWAT
jgi:hypothetical protein